MQYSSGAHVYPSMRAWTCYCMCALSGLAPVLAPDGCMRGQALIWDKKFKPYVMEYAADEEKFFKVRSCRGA